MINQYPVSLFKDVKHDKIEYKVDAIIKTSAFRNGIYLVITLCTGYAFIDVPLYALFRSHGKFVQCGLFYSSVAFI